MDGTPVLLAAVSGLHHSAECILEGRDYNTKRSEAHFEAMAFVRVRSSEMLMPAAPQGAEPAGQELLRASAKPGGCLSHSLCRALGCLAASQNPADAIRQLRRWLCYFSENRLRCLFNSYKPVMTLRCLPKPAAVPELRRASPPVKQVRVHRGIAIRKIRRSGNSLRSEVQG